LFVDLPVARTTQKHEVVEVGRALGRGVVRDDVVNFASLVGCVAKSARSVACDEG
jgi:DNA-binding helix-hairpin-helix protein with protein kinase domain